MNVAMEGQAPRMKMCLHFRETEKPLVLNITNGRRIKTYYVKDPKLVDIEAWYGIKIKLWNDPEVEFGGELTGGIRVVIPLQTNSGDVPNPDYDGAPEPDSSIAEPLPYCPHCGNLHKECSCSPDF